MRSCKLTPLLLHGKKRLGSTISEVFVLSEGFIWPHAVLISVEESTKVKLIEAFVGFDAAGVNICRL